jgi:hypothetical protein
MERGASVRKQLGISGASAAARHRLLDEPKHQFLTLGEKGTASLSRFQRSLLLMKIPQTLLVAVGVAALVSSHALADPPDDRNPTVRDGHMGKIPRMFPDL